MLHSLSLDRQIRDDQSQTSAAYQENVGVRESALQSCAFETQWRIVDGVNGRKVPRGRGNGSLGSKGQGQATRPAWHELELIALFGGSSLLLFREASLNGVCSKVWLCRPWK